MTLPVVMCVGRPNVGKSTFFNRLAGRRLALTSPQPGMTRDLRETPIEWMGLKFMLVDTPGLFGPDPNKEDCPLDMAKIIEDHAIQALNNANVILFMIDGKAGVTAIDHELARSLRKAKAPILVIVNKMESDLDGIKGLEAFELGIGDECVSISAEHALGLGDLYHVLTRYLGDEEENIQEDKPKPMRLSIMGRPNVGKSTLINSLLGEERLITADFPGVTRDSITIPWTYNGQDMELVDTAGLRKTGKISSDFEKLSAIDAKRALQYTELVVFVIDASQIEKNIRDQEPILEKQDLSLMHEIYQEGRAMVLALNKGDLIKNTDCLTSFEEELNAHFPQARGIFWTLISSKNHHNLSVLMEQAIQAHGLWCRRMSTGTLNTWLQEQLTRHPLPMQSGRRLRIKYMTQSKARPPTFILFATKSDKIPESYLRFLTNRLREDFDWPGVPLRFVLRSSKNPYKSG